MTKDSKTVPELVSAPDRFERLVRDFRAEDVLAFDLEADSLHHYREKVCLIQIAAKREVSLVDPLALSDMSPLAVLLENPSIRKVLHGADYDVRSLRRDFDIEINNLFDTMIACQFLGEKEVGLAAVLRKRFGVELDKRFQKADWSKRPLEPDMIAYAIADTSLLIDLYGQLEEELRTMGRLSWVEEESELISRATAADRNGEPFICRFKGAHKMDARTLAVLEELLVLRDEKARSYDRPPFKVLPHEALGRLAEKKPRKFAELSGIHGLSPKLIDRYGADILKAVSRGVNMPESMLPRLPRCERQKKDREQLEKSKMLKQWREAKAAELGIDAGVVTNNSLIDALAQASPRTMEDLENIKPLRNWQKKEFGDELLAVIDETA